MKIPAGRTWLYLTFGLLSYLVFLLATLPAAWLSWAVARVSNGAVAITAPSGTFWRGHGELQAGASQSLGRLEWSVNPLWLVTGQLRVGLRAGGPGTEAHADLHVRPYSSFVIEELQATFPAQLTSLVYGPAAFFTPTGKLRLTTARLELSRTGLNGDAQVLWQGAGGRFTGNTSLGDYQIDLEGKGETANIRLSTVRGDLELTGGGQWRTTGDGDLRFSGIARPRSDPAQLEPLLAALGRDQGGGRRALSFSSRVPLVQLLGF